MNDDYIKREDALQDIDNARANTITQRGYKNYWSADLETQLVCGGLTKAIEAIFDTPSVDVVEVVRCKDCKHHNETWCDMNSRDRGEWFCWYDDDFCSYGERRNDNGANVDA